MKTYICLLGVLRTGICDDCRRPRDHPKNECVYAVILILAMKFVVDKYQVIQVHNLYERSRYKLQYFFM